MKNVFTALKAELAGKDRLLTRINTSVEVVKDSVIAAGLGYAALGPADLDLCVASILIGQAVAWLPSLATLAWNWCSRAENPGSINWGQLIALTEKVLQNQDDALKIMWREIVPANLRNRDMGASEIRKWMACSDNAPYLQRITHLHLYGKGLKYIPPEIGQLTQLQVLCLNENEISEIPPEICHLAQLQSLYLSNNQIREIPPEIRHLAQLGSLGLEGNLITEIPAEIRHLAQLSILTLSNNLITEIPAEICHLAQLSILFLSNNQIREIPAEIRHLAQLWILDLKGNLITEIPGEIGQMNRLSLELGGNPIPLRIG